MVRVVLVGLLLLTAAAVQSLPSISLGPETRIIFPSVDSPVPVGSMSDLEDIYFPDDPLLTVGAKVQVDLIPGFPMDISASYGSYDPLLEFTESFPDSVDVILRKGYLVTVEAGLSHEMGEVSLMAGADFYLYHESWMDRDTTVYYGGCHRETSETVTGAYLGVGKLFKLLPVAEMGLDLKLHLPKFSERWISAGLSVMFN